MNKLVYTGSYKLLASSFKPQAKKLAACSLWLAVILVLSASSCKKEQPDPPPELPPLTHVGAMTFGCYVNGEPWVAEVPPFTPSNIPLSGGFNTKDSLFIIQANRITNSGVYETITIRIDGFDPEVKEYYNSASRPYVNYHYRCIDGSANNSFDIIHNNQNILSIEHFDYLKRILSMNFSFDVEARNCPEEQIKIREGRFDLFFTVIE